MTSLEDDRYCFACGPENPIGLCVKIEKREEGYAEIRWEPSREYQGFREILHGGIVSTLLDEAMAHAALSVVSGAATAEMTVQFRKPVRTDRGVLARAEVVEQKGRLVRARAVLVQEDEEKARAEGKFLVVRRSI